MKLISLFQVAMLCRYILDLCLTDSNILVYPVSMRAAAALCLATKVLTEEGRTDCILPDNMPESNEAYLDNGNRTHPPAVWTATLVYYSSYSELQLRPCMERCAKNLTRAVDAKLQVKIKAGQLTKKLRVI